MRDTQVIKSEIRVQKTTSSLTKRKKGVFGGGDSNSNNI